MSKIDPEQRKKEEVRQWLTASIDNLDRQIDEFEAEIESLYAGTKKKKLDRDVSIFITFLYSPSLTHCRPSCLCDIIS